jgi:DHA1 family bicyclomycin/chloramphenicol resistance-like MFS transporter
MLAPMIGGVLQDAVGWTAVFWFMAAFGVLCLAVTFTNVPETNFQRTRRLSFGTVFADFSRLLRLREFVLFALSGSLTSGVFFAFLGGAPYVAERTLGLSPSIYGLWFGTVALVMRAAAFSRGASRSDLASRA